MKVGILAKNTFLRRGRHLDGSGMSLAEIDAILRQEAVAASVREAGSDQVHHAVTKRLAKPNGRVIVGDCGVGMPLDQPAAAIEVNLCIFLARHQINGAFGANPAWLTYDFSSAA